MYKISIIMAIFNVEKYIERSLNSILNQTMDLNDIEVIMVDDNSTDSTKNIVKKYEEQYSNFKAIFHSQNSGGCAIPRNSGLKVATGEYIMFLDPDDEFAPDMCEKMYTKIKEFGVNILKCNHMLITSNNQKMDYQFDKNLKIVEINCKTELPPNTSSVCNTIHNGKFLKENNIQFPNLKNAEDIVFSINEFFNTDKIIIINDYAGYYYYTNPDISHAKKPNDKNLDAILTSYFITKKIIEKHNRTEIYQEFFSRRCMQFFLMLFNYDGNKKEYLNKFYKFEKELGKPLIFEYYWMNIINKFLMKNKINTTLLIFKILSVIRKSPLNKINRKFLS